MNLRPEVVKKSLDAVDNMKKEINENTSAVLKKLLSEAVKADVAAVDNEDTTSDVNTDGSKVEGTTDSGKTNDEQSKEEATQTPDENQDGDTNTEDWSEFDSFKGEDGKYDLTNASDEDVVRVFKKMDNTDKLRIVQDGDKVEIHDGDTGADYIIDLGEEVSNNPIQKENTNKSMSNTKLQTIYEVALGYTDSYQSKDAMTTPPNTEVAPNQHRDLNAGIPTGSEKPWAKPNKTAKPFDNKQNVTEEASGSVIEDEAQVEEVAAHASVKSTTVVKSDPTKPEGRPHRGTKPAGAVQTEGKKFAVTEAQLAKIQKIFEENESLKKSLVKFRNELNEAVVTNVATTLALKTILENTTTENEKKDIVNRFKTEAKSIDGAKALYESISRELKKTPADNLAESINQKIVAGSSAQQINEAKEQALQAENESIARIQDMMHRVCK